MPASVPTSSEFNDLTLQVTGLKDLTAKLDARLKAVEAATSNVYDDFNYTYQFLSEGATSPNGKWKSIYISGGTQKMDGSGLVMVPGGPDLRASLIQSTKQWGNAKIEFDVTTEKQVATNPTPWMCAWALFRHLDKWRHYYIAIKLNGIEFGKKDAPTTITDQAEIEKYQKILWTGGPGTAIGNKRHITIETNGDTFKISVDGTQIMSMTDVSSFKSGSFSPYCEGSQGRYDNVSVTPL